uniref:Uncharacterized protein n=1 Tax=Lotus japonicus TaxID=34305 RepID=I3T3U7_LOTJA|nr:unknown [Lotus japonicus]
MIAVVYKYMIIRTTINNLPTATCNSRLISKYSSKEVVNSNLIPSVILRNSLVNIISMWAINDDSRPRVLFIESNVIIHENNNVLFFQATFPQQLIRVTNISLVSVIPVAIGTGNQNCPPSPLVFVGGRWFEKPGSLRG